MLPACRKLELVARSKRVERRADLQIYCTRSRFNSDPCKHSGHTLRQVFGQSNPSERWNLPDKTALRRRYVTGLQTAAGARRSAPCSIGRWCGHDLPDAHRKPREARYHCICLNGVLTRPPGSIVRPDLPRSLMPGSGAAMNLMVPRERLELSRCRQRRILNPLRLPIPPSRHEAAQYRDVASQGQSPAVVSAVRFG